MEAFWKAMAVVILSVILSTAIGKTEKDLTVVLSVAACCIVSTVAMQYLSDVIVFLWGLGNNMDSNHPVIETLLKISGVALMTELSCLISSDAGSSSLGKAMQFLGNSVILFLSLPIFEAFLSVIQRIMDFL